MSWITDARARLDATTTNTDFDTVGDLRRALDALEAVLALHAEDEDGFCVGCPERISYGENIGRPLWRDCPVRRAIEGDGR